MIAMAILTGCADSTPIIDAGAAGEPPSATAVRPTATPVRPATSLPEEPTASVPLPTPTATATAIPTPTPYVHIPHEDGLVIAPPVIPLGSVQWNGETFVLTELCVRPDGRTIGSFDGGEILVAPSGQMTVNLDTLEGFTLTATQDWVTLVASVATFETGSAVHARMEFASDEGRADVSMLHGSAVLCGDPPETATRLIGDLQATLVGNTAVLDGTIGGATPDMISEIVNRHREIDTLVFRDMPGSVNDAAAQISARIIRAAGLDTHAPADASVNSGAVLLFTAGVERTYEPGAIFGVHAWGNDLVTARDLPETVDAHQRVIQFYEDMGLPDPEGYYWATVDAAPFTSIAALTPAQLEQFGIAEPQLFN